MQHSQRAIPFATNGKPSKQNSRATVTYKSTLNSGESTPPLLRSLKRTLSASYDPLTETITFTVETHSGQHKRLEQRLTAMEACA